MAKTSSTRVATAVALGLLLISNGKAVGQDHAGHSPYAEMTGRNVKALAPEEVEALLAGEGMGFALSAELNGVPGPKHALEMADGLGLSAEQVAGLEDVRTRMAAEGRRLGAEIVEAETHLDLQFARGHATPEGVLAATVEIGRLRGELRAVHLNAHLETVKLLTASQVREYARMRGYAAGHPPAGGTESDGLVEVRSDADFPTTLARVEGAVKSRGLFVMRVLDHSASAAQFGRALPPNSVVLFGNPQMGSQLMACEPRMGIDLPQKLLIWDEHGTVTVAYNDPAYLVRRHSLQGCGDVVGLVAENLEAVARRVAGVG